jgi:2-isopropylmalate synthase
MLYILKSLNLEKGTGTQVVATVVLEYNGVLVSGEGSDKTVFVYAAFHALANAIKTDATLMDFQVKTMNKGEDAPGEASVVLEKGGEFFHGRAIDTDIITASAKAYLNALNKIASFQKTKNNSIFT